MDEQSRLKREGKFMVRTMKIVACRRYGPPEVIQIEESEVPKPGDEEVLIRTMATTVTSGDWRLRSLTMPPGMGFLARMMFGFTRLRQPILGSELAGEIVEVGQSVKGFQRGDRVLVFTGAKLGCSVEFKTMRWDHNIVKIPDNLNWSEAVSLPFGGTTVLDFFRKGNVRSGEHILVNGASGNVGALAVQIAKQFDAKVTGVCSAANVEFVKSLGADHVLDYNKQDFTESGECYDVIMDTVGTAPYKRCQRVLSKTGRLLVVMGNLTDMLFVPWLAKWTSQHRLVVGAAAERLDDLQRLVELAEEGGIRAVVDSEFPVDQIVDAHRVVDSGRKRGSVVIRWDESG